MQKINQVVNKLKTIQEMKDHKDEEKDLAYKLIGSWVIQLSNKLTTITDIRIDVNKNRHSKL